MYSFTHILICVNQPTLAGGPMYLVFFRVLLDYLDESSGARLWLGVMLGVCAVRAMFGG